LFLSIADDPISFLIAVNLMIFVLGCLIESLAILLIVVPILVPIALSFGIDPVHFGIIIVLNLMISILTPPMGMALFVVAQVGNIPYLKLAKSILPWLLPPIIVLILVCIFPVLATGLPNLMG
jgi:TRAP-type C4-dicarboxylate transport system permease large subunit